MAAAAIAAAVLALAGCATTPDAAESGSTRPAATAGAAASRTEVATAAAVAGAAAAATAQATPTPPPANQAPGAARPPGPAVNAAAAAAAAAVATAQGMRPFADVVKDATETKGLVTLWQKDDRVWLELAPEQFGKLYFLTSNLNRGIGENRIFGGMMNYPAGITQVVEFRKVGALVQLIAKNTKYTAKAGTPEARAVAAGFSDSLVATVPVASQPHPERKSILVDANALFVADLPAAAITLERTYRQPYAFDARNSSLDRARVRPDLATFEVTAHYALSRPQVAPAFMPGSPVPTSVPSLPNTLPDVRSLFLGFFYSLVALPETPMRPRAGRRAGRLLHRRDLRLHQRRPPHAGAASRHALAAGEEGSGRARCRSRSSRSCSGWTATFRSPTASRCAPASWSGTRRSSASATRMR